MACLCATLLALPALAQNPQAPRGQGSATAPNAQGMMTDPGPRPGTQAPSGVPGSTNVNPNETPQPVAPSGIAPGATAPSLPPRPAN
jgi:hypothetical protein